MEKYEIKKVKMIEMKRGRRTIDYSTIISTTNKLLSGQGFDVPRTKSTYPSIVRTLSKLNKSLDFAYIDADGNQTTADNKNYLYTRIYKR